MAEFYVKVQPDSEEFKIEEDSIIKVSLTQPAEKGKANTQLIHRMEQVLGQKPAIISGHHSKRKKLKVNITEEELEDKIAQEPKE